MEGTQRITPNWIAADWGTSRLRVWAMGDGSMPLAEASSDKGMAVLEKGAFEPALLELVAPWLADGRQTSVFACGMVGARQGWIEAPYRAVPCPPAGGTLPAPVRDPRLAVHIVSGLMQESPADVMRGEETQVAGFVAGQPGFDGVLCLPGTHTKWVHVSAGEVVSFQTSMTGELFSLLAGRSVLRHAVGVLPAAPGAAAFAEGVSETLSRPERLASRLFGLRAESLIADLPPAAAAARLSGLLVGADLAAARPYWLGQPVVLIGAPALADAYAAALSLQGVAAERADVATVTLAGLDQARKASKGPST